MRSTICPCSLLTEQEAELRLQWISTNVLIHIRSMHQGPLAVTTTSHPSCMWFYTHLHHHRLGGGCFLSSKHVISPKYTKLDCLCNVQLVLLQNIITNHKLTQELDARKFVKICLEERILNFPYDTKFLNSCNDHSQCEVQSKCLEDGCIKALVINTYNNIQKHIEEHDHDWDNL